MSTSKQILRKAPEAASDVTVDDVVDVPSSGLKNIEVTSLELDEEFEAETDPYNRTGSHFVAALRRKQD